MSQPYKLDNVHRIVANDARQWTLQRLRSERDEDEMDADDARPARPEHLKGEELWSDVGYYASIESLCRAWAQRSARTSTATLPQALAKACKRLEAVLGEIEDATSAL